MKADEFLAKYFLYIFLLSLAFCSVMYLGYSFVLAGYLGFPLDDSWIHQTIARGLATYGQFAYNFGERVSGSTSAFWTILLAVGYALSINFQIWTYALGLLFHGLSGWLVYLLAVKIFPSRRGVARVAALAYLIQWQMLWASLSGMETNLFIFLSLLLIYLTLDSTERSSNKLVGCALQGLVGGLIFLTRPEGVVLFIITLLWKLAAFLGIWRPFSRKNGVTIKAEALPRRIAVFLFRELLIPIAIALLFVFPYLLFNYSTIGEPLPSTYYAKNAAYAVPLDAGFVLSYLAAVVGFLFSGITPLLFLGLVSSLVLVIRYSFGRLRGLDFVKEISSLSSALLPIAWSLTMIVLYLIKLPMLYQHGRYLMPILPFTIIYGIWGLRVLGERMKFRVFVKAYGILTLALFIALSVNGAQTYAWNVKLINDEQVTVANWVKDNTPADAIIATHDVGALGYFSQRRLFDTAGLLNPEVVPYLRDQNRLLEMAEQRGASFFAIMPDWYPQIAADDRLQEIFRVKFPNAQIRDTENMIVLHVK